MVLRAHPDSFLAGHHRMPGHAIRLVASLAATLPEKNTMRRRAGHSLTQSVSIILCENSSAFWSAAVIWPSEVNNAERSTTNTPPSAPFPPASEGGPLEAPPKASKTLFPLYFPSQSGLKTCVAWGWLQSSKQEISKKCQETYIRNVWQ